MLNNVSNGTDLYTNTNIKQQQEVLGVDKRGLKKNPYAKADGFVDQSDISELARKLYEQDREKLKFTQIVTDDLNSISNNDEITNLVNSSYISNDDLAESLLNNDDFLSMFAG